MKQAPESDLEISTGSPSQLADKLSRGKLDLAMIPAIEYLKQADSYRLIPDISISSRNKVGSVLLASSVPLNAVRSLAVDNRSRTSIALLQVLYPELFSGDLKLNRQEPDPDVMLNDHDAALIIGDQALGFSKEGVSIYDLSEEWFVRTEKTFVHAVIAVREGVRMEAGTIQVLLQAKREGLQNLDTIIQDEAKRTGHSIFLLRDYLANKIRYDFGREEIYGLMQFQLDCYKAGLVENRFPLKFI